MFWGYGEDESNYTNNLTEADFKDMDGVIEYLKENEPTLSTSYCQDKELKDFYNKIKRLPHDDAVSLARSDLSALAELGWLNYEAFIEADVTKIESLEKNGKKYLKIYLSEEC